MQLGARKNPQINAMLETVPVYILDGATGGRPANMAAMMTTSLTQSNSQEASTVFAIWGSKGNSDMMMPISERFPSLSRAAK